MSGEAVTRPRAPMVRYRSTAGEFGESRLDRVSTEVLLSGMPVREFRWFKGASVLFRLVLVGYDVRVGGL